MAPGSSRRRWGAPSAPGVVEAPSLGAGAARGGPQEPIERDVGGRGGGWVRGALVILPPMDPVPVPPEYLQEEEGARAVKVARENHLAALLAAWRIKQG